MIHLEVENGLMCNIINLIVTLSHQGLRENFTSFLNDSKEFMVGVCYRIVFS